jgi:opacity protein-like surface antigen
MKYVYSIVALLVLASSASFPQADASSKRSEISVSGGLGFSNRPLEFVNFWNKGFNLGAGYGIVVGSGDFGYSVVQAELTYSSFAFVQDSVRSIYLIPSTATISSSPLSVITLMLNYRGTIAASQTSIGPYFLIGVGAIDFMQKEITVDGVTLTKVPSVSKFSFAWQAGVGVSIPFTEKFGMFVEGRTVVGFVDDGKQYFPVSAGVRLTQ